MSKTLITAPAIPQTFQEACDTLRRLEQEARQCSDVMRQKGREMILLRFRQGRTAHLALGMRREDHYGTAAMDTLSERSGVHSRTLYQALQFYRDDRIPKAEAQLQAWMDTVEEEKGRISWSYCRNLVQKALPETPEKAERKLEDEVQKLEAKSTRLEQEAGDLEQAVTHWNGNGKDEALGVIAKAREVAADTRQQAERLVLVSDPKPMRWESADYLRHVRSYGCLICGEEADAHHITTGGMGTKGHDLFTVPLCRAHHGELHQGGALTFQETHQLNLWQNVAYIQAEYFTDLKLV